MSSIYNTGLQTTDKKLYFLDLETGDRLEIQFVPPVLDIKDNADVATIKIVGRNLPRYQTTGGEVTLNLDLDFYADETSMTSVVRKCNWLRSLRYTNGKKAAKRVALVFGDLFKKEIWTVMSVNPKYSDYDKVNGFMPKQAYVAVSLCLDVDYNMGAGDVNVNYPVGQADGSNPINLGEASPDDENTDWINVTNDNSFAAIRERALQRLGLVSTITHGYYS